MISGLLAGLFWGLDTVIIGVALAMSPFVDWSDAMIIAPFASTFLHDVCSSIWMFIYSGFKKEYRNILAALKTRGGKFIVLGALMGGPIGMSGYVAAIYFMGPSYTAIISSIFPAVGAFFAYIILKEKMRNYQMVGLMVSIVAIAILSFTSDGFVVKNYALGLLCACICVVGWSLEAVICSYGLKTSDIKDDNALHLRQCTSALFYGVVIITIISAWPKTIEVISSPSIYWIAASALFGTISYLCYYKAIKQIGATKAMALNITYTVWSMVFAFILLGTKMDVSTIVLAILIIGGSLLATTDIKK